MKVFVREGAKVVAADISGGREGHRRRGRRRRAAGPLRRHERSRRRGDDRRPRSRSSVASTSCSTWPASPTRMMIADVTMAHYDKMMDVDLRGVLLGMKHGIRAMLEQARRRDRQLVVDRRPQRRAVHGRLLGGQGRRHRAHQGRGGRVRRAGHPRQRDLPRLHPHRDHGRPPRAHARHPREGGAEPRRPGGTRSPRSPRSSRPTAPRSSPARSSRSTAAGP